MKKQLYPAAAILIVLLRFLPGFAEIWAAVLSRPALRFMADFSNNLPFVLLEWFAAACGILLCIALIRGTFLKCAGRMILCFSAAFFALWYPLYAGDIPVPKATPAQIHTLCNELIDALNGSEVNFENTETLPAKYARFPVWMDAMNISGFCSFLTGEALVAPDLPAASLPFVAVHEDMHLHGHAGEGAANIAAWEKCMSLGGAYADSARIWTLRYGMGMLRREAPELYDGCLVRMDENVLWHYRAAGGAYTPEAPGKFLSFFCRLLGVGAQMQDYEILAPYLAVGFAQ